jgi:hypothetical protein
MEGEALGLLRAISQDLNLWREFDRILQAAQVSKFYESREAARHDMLQSVLDTPLNEIRLLGVTLREFPGQVRVTIVRQAATTDCSEQMSR